LAFGTTSRLRALKLKNTFGILYYSKNIKMVIARIFREIGECSSIKFDFTLSLTDSQINKILSTGRIQPKVSTFNKDKCQYRIIAVLDHKFRVVTISDEFDEKSVLSKLSPFVNGFCNSKQQSKAFVSEVYLYCIIESSFPVQTKAQQLVTSLAHAEQICHSATNSLNNLIAEVRNYRMNMHSFMSELMNEEYKQSCNKCQVSNHNIRTTEESSTTPTHLTNVNSNNEYHDVVSDDSSINYYSMESDINRDDPKSSSEVELILDFSTIYEDNNALSDVFNFDINCDIRSKLKSYEMRKSIFNDFSTQQIGLKESPFDYLTLNDSLNSSYSYVPSGYMVGIIHFCLMFSSLKSCCFGRFAVLIPYGDPEVAIPPEPPPITCC
jgi:hypothetical protein